VEAVG
jgi:hypothetical protein